jgi:hypothetical protein
MAARCGGSRGREWIEERELGGERGQVEKKVEYDMWVLLI